MVWAANLKKSQNSMIEKWIGRYKLSGEVSFGGMGAVYQASNSETGDLVAVKLLSPEYLNDLGLRAAFEREAQLVTGLIHEAIVPVYEFGQEDGQPYLVMQYMAHGSLADRLLHGMLSPEQVLHILDRICRAIDYAHQQGIIHRDLKPSNILFDEHDEAHLADFGIARLTTSRQASLPINGTPAYLSPEQALGEDEIDGRCDIYALGIILFETLTGQLPFDGQIPITVILKQIHDQPPSLRAVVWNLPAALDDVIQRALAKDPAERFSTAGELASAYRLALYGSSENLDPVSKSEQQADQITVGSSDEGISATQGGSEMLENPAAPRFGQDRELHSSASGRIDYFGSWHGSIREGWQLAHILAMGIATLMGVWMAAGLTAFLYLPLGETLGSDGFVGLNLSFDRSSLILANNTSEPLDLTGLSFQRIVVGNAPSADFQGSRWFEATRSEQQVLLPGECYQLLLPDAASFALKPGESLPVLPGCDSLQGWLVVTEPESWFWLSEGDSGSFQVILDGTPVQTCPIVSGICRFSIASP